MTGSFFPLVSCKEAGSFPRLKEGQELIAQGLLGCLLLAGGEGSRLGWEGPKGTFPITPIQKKSLFELFSEKILAAGRQAGVKIPLSIMTSPLNHDATALFFKRNQSFGLSSQELFFFQQGMRPLLDLNKRPLGKSGPDGNGCALARFVESGLFEQWWKRGIRYLNLFLVDNPLSDPCDAELLGHHLFEGADWTVKGVRRKDPTEKVGVLGVSEGKLFIIEYTDLPPSDALRFPFANSGMYCISMELVFALAKEKESLLPLHLVLKSEKERQFYKQETFLFDLLPYAKKAQAVLYPRERVFAPFKTMEDLPGVRAALQENGRRIFEEATEKRRL
ncbi:MAG: hypothetical protein A3D18_02660 [Chlamydiae bacterium RIFCSPHIGHO2_02_FULL_49_29]|nr:MAG: hypothetical protein A2098_01380 [Chlamydiae bacterium GWF2_49_8]OGN57476.1 MAG: hypothetical protein A3D18_02660 [Chlamydiae bacterium RIFCSPHIGHO2_02_FULL_49_29]OGN70819.1 MAG: hypothetical protein A3I15_03360 [Chlamydiae bacterium RIFCSPLOWO2_02_FULL_49_12]